MERDIGSEHRYDDIIELPYRKSGRHVPMPTADRAVQFAPFAALTGLGAAMSETARRTEERIELDEEQKTLLDEKLQRILACIQEEPVVRICFFEPDEWKSGGAYVTAQGILRKVDRLKRVITLSGGQKISMDEVIEIDRIREDDYN